MLNYIIDTNILIGALISGKASYKPIFKAYNFSAPTFLLTELEKYQTTVFLKSKLDEHQLRQFCYDLFTEITIVPQLVLSKESLEKANILTRDVDIKDTAYIALAIQLNQVLITRDKALIKGLKKKGFRKILLFDDFLKNL